VKAWKLTDVFTKPKEAVPMVAQEEVVLQMQTEFEELVSFVLKSAQEGVLVAPVEREIRERVSRLGFEAMQAFIEVQGDGDVGETFELPEGPVLRRLEEPSTRRYVTVFGEVEITRRVYGTRKKQRFEAVPLDARLGLPESDFSPLAQEWCQRICVNNAFAEAKALVKELVGLEISVDALEQMNRSTAKDVPAFQSAQSSPPPEEEGELKVVMADGKGIPMRRQPEDPRPRDPKHLRKGEKKNKKRMAYVGVSYTVDRNRRDVARVVSEIFDESSVTPERPTPQHKRIHAELGGEPAIGRQDLFQWLGDEIAKRNPDMRRPLVFVSDGEPALEELARERFGEFVSVLDIMHVLTRIWDLAHCFHPEGSDESHEFVASRLARLLAGNVDSVIRGARQMSTKHNLQGNRKKTVAKATQYFEDNRHRMQYDEYLAAGFPIGSGPVEGTCRNLVKDRFECSGMRWSLSGAQAMLATRATWANDDWKDFCQFRTERETERLYPYRHTVLDLWN